MARPMRIWITRPAEDAAELSEALRAEGIGVLVEPLLRIVITDGPRLDLNRIQALLATSANGVRAFARRNDQRDLPVLAVGDATARSARDAGFAHVESASGDVVALAQLVRRRLDPARGPLLHIASTDVAGDLGGSLAEAGYTYRREVLYTARASRRLSEALVADIRRGAIDGVLVFSPRTGKTLVRLLQAAGLAALTPRLICFCLSPAFGAVVAPLAWRDVVIARQATQAAIIAEVGAAAARLSPGDAANSALPKQRFTGYSRRREHRPAIEGRGMSSETDKNELPENAAPDAAKPLPSAHANAGERSEVAIDEAPVPTERAVEAGPSESAASPPPPEQPPFESVVAEPGQVAPRPWTKAAPSEGVSPADAATGPSADSAAPPPAQEPRRRSRAVLWALVVMALLAGAGALAYHDYIEPRLRQFTQAPPVDLQAEFNAAFEDLEARQIRLRQQVEALAPRVDAIERTLAGLRQSVDKLATVGPAVDPEVVKQLGERIALLESQASAASGLAQQVRSLEASTAVARDTTSKLATTVLAIGQLMQAVGDGGAFVRQLAAVRALGGEDPDIAQAAAEIEPYAAIGVPTLAALRAQLPATIDAVIRATPIRAGDSWTDRTINRLASLVTVRRVGPEAIASGGIDGIVAQAETALDGGDLQAAVTVLERLDGAPAQAAADWLQHARARLAADRALATLQQRAIARLATARG
jgi:uroporphyrinogen-III synthase